MPTSSSVATGTPEPNGLPPAFLLELIARLGETTGLIGGDVMEVAPCLRDQPDRTIETAVSYLRATLSAALKTEV